MKKLFLFCFVAITCTAASAQKAYFLYLQTDDQVPFYVRMSDKIYSSAVSGYLILPNLTDSTYNLSLGFAKSTQPETKFAVAINQNDKGYLIKNFQEGLALFDMQNLSIVKPVSANKNTTVYETRSDKFSSVLSKAADDPGLLKVAVVKKEEPKIEPEKKEVVISKNEETKPVEEKPKETVVAKAVDPVANNTEKREEPIVKIDSTVSAPITKTEDVQQPVVNEERPVITDSQKEYKRSKVKRRSESSTTEGFGIVYFDKTDEYVDTIRILIPPSKTKIADEVDESVKAEPQVKYAIVDSAANDLKKTNDSLISSSKEVAKTTVATLACTNVASEKDFMKLRKNMAAKSNDEDMISEAKKSFKSKCFTAEQIRYLSTLFLTSAAKYQFFDAAYNYVSDKQGYSSLQSEIKEEYYLKRFKALIGE